MRCMRRDEKREQGGFAHVGHACLLFRLNWIVQGHSPTTPTERLLEARPSRTFCSGAFFFGAILRLREALA
jgi:hypothetical protein